MQYKIEYTQSYEKIAFKFLKKHKNIVPKYKKCIQLLELNPFHPSLRLHKLQGKLDGLYSVSIDMQYRISIEFYIENNRIVPIDIGTHDKIYK
jgi:mRNA-degrading endonuclease YafQ of YafQ-DinJ toxin-antitoxin module